jgi:hypothetical protein
VAKCKRFIANQNLTRELYCLQSAVAADELHSFVAAIEGTVAEITVAAVRRVRLCSPDCAIVAISFISGIDGCGA